MLRVWPGKDSKLHVKLSYIVCNITDPKIGSYLMVGGKMIYVNPTLVRSEFLMKLVLKSLSDFIGRIGAHVHEIKHGPARTDSCN